jgi:hypothetical protein
MILSIRPVLCVLVLGYIKTALAAYAVLTTALSGAAALDPALVRVSYSSFILI